MISIPVAKKISSVSEFSAEGTFEGQAPFLLSTIQHIYIKLDLQHQFENAKTADDANSFLRSVARAAMAASQIAEHHDGWLLEVQGSMLHIGLPMNTELGSGSQADAARKYLGDIHAAYMVLFGHSRSRVDGWRMTVDTGRTLVVSGRGVHGDSSLVSLGRSANRPAKHLYSQLERPEESRQLKRFHAGIYDAESRKWRYEDLNSLTSTLSEAREIAKGVRSTEPKLDYSRFITASAAPIPVGGHPAAPSVDRPYTYYGWVMRTDLDGFTARVDACLDDDTKLGELAVGFYQLMDAAAEFVHTHEEALAQLPWAGDNFTAAAVFISKSEYESAIPRQLIELTLDFEKEMKSIAESCGFGGWAHSIAGGEVHGNANGNIYIAGIEIGQRRFLVGAGEGVGRSIQGFGDIDPGAGEAVVYSDDWRLLDEDYKQVFVEAASVRGGVSTLFRSASVIELLRSRGRQAVADVEVKATFSAGNSENVVVRPYFHE